MTYDPIEEFPEYVASFYANDRTTTPPALYPLAPTAQVHAACTLVAGLPDFVGDSFDREKVRGVLESLGFIENTSEMNDIEDTKIGQRLLHHDDLQETA